MTQALRFFLLLWLSAFFAEARVSRTYDAAGNRLTRTSTLDALIPNASHAYDANNRLQSDRYDANGNTLSAPGFGMAQPDRYDFENRLVERTIAGKTITITYDGDGNRARITVTTATNTVTTLYLVDTVNPTGYAQVLEEHVSQNSSTPILQRVFTFGLTLLAQDQLLNGVWTVRYHGLDGHGNTRYLTDALGDITDTYDYDAFGNLIAATGSTPNNFLFTSEQLDPDLGLYFLRARYQDTSTGRFWTMDEFEGFGRDPSSLHKYLYAAPNPIMFIDPTGRAVTLAELKVTIGVGAVVGAALQIPGIIKDWDQLTVADIARRLGLGAIEGAATSLIGGFAGKLALKMMPQFSSLLLRAAAEGAAGAGISTAAKELFEVIFLGKPLQLRDRFGRVLTATAVGIIIGGVTMKLEPVRTVTGHPTRQLQEGLGEIPIPWIYVEQHVISWYGVAGSLGAEAVQSFLEDHVNQVLGISSN
jgi:RHS repeat-associated protein